MAEKKHSPPSFSAMKGPGQPFRPEILRSAPQIEPAYRRFSHDCCRYPRLEERRFEFVPVWGVVVFLAYRMRRVDCSRCGVTAEMMPWCDGKNQLTTTYRWFLSTWAKRLSWSQVAAIFRTSWESVCRAVGHAVEWGLAHRDLSELTAVGIDEVAWGRGHTYLTLVYDIGWAGMAAQGVARPARLGTVWQA
jgi:transposase